MFQKNWGFPVEQIRQHLKPDLGFPKQREQKPFATQKPTAKLDIPEKNEPKLYKDMLEKFVPKRNKPEQDVPKQPVPPMDAKNINRSFTIDYENNQFLKDGKFFQ